VAVLLMQELMTEIESFDAEFNRTRSLGHEVIATDNKLAELIESQLNGLDDNYQALLAGAQATHV